MTFDTYGHLFPRAREEASAKLEEAIRKGRREAIASGRRRNQSKGGVLEVRQLNRNALMGGKLEERKASERLVAGAGFEPATFGL